MTHDCCCRMPGSIIDWLSRAEDCETGLARWTAALRNPLAAAELVGSADGAITALPRKAGASCESIDDGNTAGGCIPPTVAREASGAVRWPANIEARRIAVQHKQGRLGPQCVAKATRVSSHTTNNSTNNTADTCLAAWCDGSVFGGKQLRPLGPCAADERWYRAHQGPIKLQLAGIEYNHWSVWHRLLNTAGMCVTGFSPGEGVLVDEGLGSPGGRTPKLSCDCRI